MNPLLQLALTERIRLLQVLESSQLVGQASPQMRRSVLTIAGLEKYIQKLNFEDQSLEFVNNLCSELGVIDKTDQKSPLVQFVEYVLMAGGIYSEDDALFLEYCILRWAKSGMVPRSRDLIPAVLYEERSRITPQENKMFQIDPQALLNYNLEKQMGNFRKKLDYEGVFPFATGGKNQDILRNYVLPRLLKELSHRTGHTCKPLYDIYLHPGDQMIPEVLDFKLATRYTCTSLADLVLDRMAQDVMLVIWTQHTRQRPTVQEGEALLNYIHTSVGSSLVGSSSCLVVIWVDVGRAARPIKGFTTIPELEQFDTRSLNIWFRGFLQTYQVPQERIDHYRKRVGAHRGDLTGTYYEIQSIIQELRGDTRVR